MEKDPKTIVSKCLLDTPQFTIKLNGEIFNVNEFTLRNLLIAQVKREFDAKFEVETWNEEEAKASFTVVINGELIDQPIDTNKLLTYYLSTDLWHEFKQELKKREIRHYKAV